MRRTQGIILIDGDCSPRPTTSSRWEGRCSTCRLKPPPHAPCRPTARTRDLGDFPCRGVAQADGSNTGRSAAVSLSLTQCSSSDARICIGPIEPDPATVGLILVLQNLESLCIEIGPGDAGVGIGRVNNQ